MPMITRKNHNSTESLRPNEDVTGHQSGNQALENTTMPPPLHAEAVEAAEPPLLSDPLKTSYKRLSHSCSTKAARQINAQPPIIAQTANRKRKPTSTHHSAASGHAHPRYRTRSMMVVYYDSAIQEAFEALVRSIAGARNTLRKGKATANLKSRIASMGVGSDNPFAGPSDFAMLNPKLRGGITRSGLGLRDDPDDKTKDFEIADKDLETAQSLCEVAAHQFLRDGDCRLEIDGTRKRFEAALGLAKREVERIRTEQETEAVEAKKAEEKSSLNTSTDESMNEKVPFVEVVQQDSMAPEPVKEINFTGTGTIEIDDGSDAESVHIDISAIRNNIRVRRA